jgi:hypothetical protein
VLDRWNGDDASWPSVLSSLSGAGRARPHKMLSREHRARAHSARGDHAGTASHPLSEICLLGAQGKSVGVLPSLSLHLLNYRTI